MAKRGNPNLVPGVSGNPAGRPPGVISVKRQIQEALLAVLAKPTTVGTGKDKTTTTTLSAFIDTFLAAGLTNPEGKAGLFLAEKVMTGDMIDKLDSVLNASKKEDKEFISYRIYKKCHDIQQEIMRSSARRICLMAGRRSGKSEVTKHKSAEVALLIDNARVLYIAKTVDIGMKQFFNDTVKIIQDNGGTVIKTDRSSGVITLDNGSEIHVRGNNSSADRENLRGGKWHLVIIDEVQSQPNLLYLINDIIEPMLVDYNGQLILCGTGPKSKGTHWEFLWNSESKQMKKWNWNLSQNPFIINYEKVLDKIIEEKGLTLDSPLIQREYLGLIAYDTDAMVFRLEDKNYFTDAELMTWIDSQPIDDLKFSSGLDFGYEDADGFSIILYSKTRPEKFVIYEYKARRTGITDLVTAIQNGLSYIKNDPIYQPIPDTNKFTYIHYDTGGAGKKIGSEFKSQYQLPTLGATKHNKKMAIELLQEECRTGNFKVRRDGPFADESLKTIWARDDNDNLTREFDESYHPDIVDSTLYALRPIWTGKGIKLNGSGKPDMSNTSGVDDGWDKHQTIWNNAGLE